MIELARSEPEIPVRPDQFDSDPNLLNVANGTLELRTGKLKAHDRADLITRISPVEWDPCARCELWESVLVEAVDDADSRDFLQRVAGYTAFGHATEDTLILIHGPPRAMKGTVQGAIEAALGEYALTAGLDDFAEKKAGQGGGPRPELVRLRGARMVSLYETSARLRLSSSLIKTLCGGDPVTARGMYERRPVTFVPQFTLWIATNHRPTVPDDDAAIWERLRELRFEKSIPPEDRDPKIRPALRDPKRSGPAVLRWIVDGAAWYLERGIDAPELVQTATANYREAMDPLADFISECCVMSETCFVKAGDLRAAYEAWCQENGERAISGEESR